MKNILFDIISAQGYVNGGGEYVNKVFTSLLERLKQNSSPYTIYCLYDSKLRFVYPESTPDALKKLPYVEFVDIQNHSLERIISEKNISTFFIGIAQRYGEFDFSNIQCRVVMVIHDLFDYEQDLNHVTDYIQSYYTKTFRLKRRIVKVRDFLLMRKIRKNGLGNLIEYLKNN